MSPAPSLIPKAAECGLSLERRSVRETHQARCLWPADRPATSRDVNRPGPPTSVSPIRLPRARRSPGHGLSWRSIKSHARSRAACRTVPPSRRYRLRLIHNIKERPPGYPECTGRRRLAHRRREGGILSQNLARVRGFDGYASLLVLRPKPIQREHQEAGCDPRGRPADRFSVRGGPRHCAPRRRL